LLLPLVLAYFYFAHYDAHAESDGRQCTILYLTGLQCPGCGGQRSLHYLLHGDILSALRYNVLFVIGFPFLLYLYYVILQMYILRNEKYRQRTVISTHFVYILLIVLLLFFILRNIPVEPFTYLSPPE
jgi:hypothetical protein